MWCTVISRNQRCSTQKAKSPIVLCRERLKYERSVSTSTYTYVLSVVMRQRHTPSLVLVFLCLNPPSIRSHKYCTATCKRTHAYKQTFRGRFYYTTQTNITIFRTKNNEKRERNKKTTTFQLGFDFIIQIVKDG